jgi:hypothetical protein
MLRRLRNGLTGAGLLIGALIEGDSYAALLTFDDETAFLAAAGSLGFEGFEDTAPGFTGTSRALSGFVIGPLDPGVSHLEILDDPSLAAEGRQSAGGNITGVFLAFGEPVTALGFTVADFGNAAAADQLVLGLSLAGEPVAEVIVASTTDPFQAFRFFGVISSEPFGTAEVTKGIVDDFIALDAVHFGQATAVPEPATVVMLTLGLPALLGCRKILRKRGAHFFRST